MRFPLHKLGRHTAIPIHGQIEFEVSRIRSFRYITFPSLERQGLPRNQGRSQFHTGGFIPYKAINSRRRSQQCRCAFVLCSVHNGFKRKLRFRFHKVRRNIPVFRHDHIQLWRQILGVGKVRRQVPGPPRKRRTVVFRQCVKFHDLTIGNAMFRVFRNCLRYNPPLSIALRYPLYTNPPFSLFKDGPAGTRGALYLQHMDIEFVLRFLKYHARSVVPMKQPVTRVRKRFNLHGDAFGYRIPARAGNNYPAPFGFKNDIIPP
ncbi:MAG: hypothetical protein BWY09_02222 [Candidatus Hydrogenedentes bacterium ADurb.Bin179]|nr:MAG: hypothetical protein BWY09_02222 [Candidatus Hydrogenedentes bacterium ADurb.Bin179]